MNRTPNSIDIKIQKTSVPKGTKKQYLCCYTDVLSLAMINLTYRAFQVYLCLMFNSNGYTLNFSPQHISELTGMCPDSVRKGKNELIEKRYLIPVEGKKSLYIFYEAQQPAINEAICIAHEALFNKQPQQSGYIEYVIPIRESKPQKKENISFEWDDSIFDD